MKQPILKKFFTGVPALFALAMLVLPSCVAEELEYCPPRLFITTDHEEIYGSRAGTGERTTRTDVVNWFTSIDSVSVYVFDESSRFVTLWTGGKYTVDEVYEVPLEELRLPEGLYTFVVWTNRGEGHDYTCNVLQRKPGDSIDEFWLRTYVPEDGSMDGDLEHRHYGRLEKVYISNNALQREYTIVVNPAVHRVHFSMRSGIDDFDNNRRYELTVTDHNSLHNFDNKSIGDSGEKHTYTSVMEPGLYRGGTRAEETALTASMDMLQLQDETGTRVDVTDRTTGKTIFDEDLVRLIQMVYDNNLDEGAELDFEHTLEFEVDINILSDVLIELWVNGWYYKWNRVILQ